MKENNYQDIEQLLQKMLVGTLSENEKDEIRKYMASTWQDERLNDFMSRHWATLDARSADSDEAGLDDLKSRILLMIMNDPSLSRPAAGRKIRLNPPGWLVRIAAVLTIPLLIFSGYLYYRLNGSSSAVKPEISQEVVATPGSRVHFMLADKTEVWLNSGSTLSFSTGLYEQQQRRVKLTGQGYFLVSKDEEHPFIVETGDLNIKVLGTAFDVSNYANDEFISSTLEHGAIALLNSDGEELAVLRTGENAVYKKTSRELAVNQVNTRIATSWKDGQLIFREAPLKEVTTRLERWFNCSINVDPELASSGMRFTATIQDETLGEVLKMVEISAHVRTKITKREAWIWIE
ncbi:MAG: FecR domain-containing protein [Prolixibacteraceae bacterium]